MTHESKRTSAPANAGRSESGVTEPPPPNVHLEEWHLDLKALYRGHWEAARYYQDRYTKLGGVAAILAAVAATGAFTQLTQIQVPLIQVGVGIFAILAAAIGGLQTFLRDSDQAAIHRRAGQRYGTMHRELDDYRMRYLQHPEKEKELDRIQEEWSAADAEFPAIPSRIYEAQKKQVRKRAAEDRRRQEIKKPTAEAEQLQQKVKKQAA